MKQYICDRCGKPIKDYDMHIHKIPIFDTYYTTTNKPCAPYNDEMYDMTRHYQKVDLCEHCMELLDNINEYFISMDDEGVFETLKKIKTLDK